MNILFVSLVLIIQLLIFFSFGLLIFKFLHIKIVSITLILLCGFSGFFCVFGIITLPLILTSQKLSILAYTLGIFSILIIIATIVFCYNQFAILLTHISSIFSQHSYMLLPLLIVTLVLQLAVFTHIDTSADSSYYIGKVATDVYTNTMGHYDPYTGFSLSSLDGRRVIACFPEYNAAISYLFHIHPLKQAKLIMPQLFALFTLLVYYQIGLCFFSGNKKKADCLVCITFLLDLYSYTVYTNSTFLLTRTYEGKSILANIIIPGVFLCFLMLWGNSNIKIAKIFLFSLSLSSCFFSSSAMLIIPISLTIGLAIWLYNNRSFKNILFCVACISPNLIVCILYFLFTKGIIIYSI